MQYNADIYNIISKKHDNRDKNVCRIPNNCYDKYMTVRK